MSRRSPPHRRTARRSGGRRSRVGTCFLMSLLLPGDSSGGRRSWLLHRVRVGGRHRRAGCSSPSPERRARSRQPRSVRWRSEREGCSARVGQPVAIMLSAKTTHVMTATTTTRVPSCMSTTSPFPGRTVGPRWCDGNRHRAAIRPTQYEVRELGVVTDGAERPLREVGMNEAPRSSFGLVSRAV